MHNNPGPAAAEHPGISYAHPGGSLSLPGPVLVGLIRDVFARGLPFRFSAPGTSMSPFIRDSDVITLAPYNPASCSPGIVVAFVRSGTCQLVVHRVVAVSVAGCRIRGDNSPEEDGEFPHACIIGQVIRIERAGKTVRFGLGPERRIIALFSRLGWLTVCIGAAGKVISVLRRRS
jgi:hypothetical protein